MAIGSCENEKLEREKDPLWNPNRHTSERIDLPIYTQNSHQEKLKTFSMAVCRCHFAMYHIACCSVMKNYKGVFCLPLHNGRSYRNRTCDI